MSEGSWFFGALKWIFVSPFKLIGMLFKLKLRHTIVWLFVIVMFISSLGDAITHKNIAYVPLGLGRLILGADQNISRVILELANADKITFAGHSWLVFNMIGSLYLIGYILYYMQEFFMMFNRDMPPFLTFIIYFLLFFALKMVYLAWEGQVVGEPYSLNEAGNWFNAMPFKFIFDLVANFDKLYLQVEPVIDVVKNITEPYTGVVTNGSVVLNGT